ncbi:hypothetical protein Mmc1_0089 [Magnetococcus marinus MC-1]|uniref:Uncharacterized protein n=1 Tax=Magnetococcus marinus (strain ATCC BAA-1437 / JCM 17883 / MC-1) TaxID=156889 RepID=A0L3S5_MAGMM|nr:hypothetical protein [Magnetococcus marinus]ABK42618.1 hypothetical protein Mmc1_0089 [Magnetococcus marinus MC-1]
MQETEKRFFLWRFIDDLDWFVLIVVAIMLGAVPFGEPHLWQKLTMLAAGTLTKPLDIFDLCMHGTPSVLLAIKAIRHYGGFAPVKEKS